MAEIWAPIGAAIARLLGPQAEVVVHDPVTDRVLAIWNPMSRRGPGDPSLLGELDTMTPDESGVYGPYQKLLPDGRRLSSVSAVVSDDEGSPIFVLCVNLDRTPFEQAAELLSAFAAPVTERPKVLFEHDWTERINQVVGGYVREHGRQAGQLTREDRLSVLAELDRLGVFDVRRAAPLVARALRISRSGLYALLAELRDQRSDR
ncbi:helix-turn-helix transcriptional regulator [Amycolatopsis nigrescens]|uniref:helix-turn-helix transcriptional regulator n=1 Tax=Amycolatopsis nigrescens TaxID=381445 RepID=UPI0003694E55|nr:PAS domain-containing protein [Amycolatopsis nigrescens]